MQLDGMFSDLVRAQFIAPRGNPTHFPCGLSHLEHQFALIMALGRAFFSSQTASRRTLPCMVLVKKMAVDESTPLLENSQAKTKTPLPKVQLGLTLFVLFSEPMSSLYIFPFINQLIRELGVTGGDDRKIGYYAGVIESLFFVTQALTVLYWSRLSDHVGRKPVLLVGLAGLSISNLCFGISREFWAFVASRCIAGALNGNVGVMRSVVGEITDTTNMAQAFTLVPMVFSVGASIAPLIGGGLVKPHDRWPELFSGVVLGANTRTSCPSAIVRVVHRIFLFNNCASLPSKRLEKSELQLERGSIGSQVRHPGRRRYLPYIDSYTTQNLFGDYTLSQTTVYWVSSTLASSLLYPYFTRTPVEIGGLGLPPFTIGLIMMAFSVGNGLFQVLFTARAIERFGERRVFCSAVLVFFPIIATFPIMSWIVEVQKEVGLAIWVLIFAQLLLWAVVDMAYAVICVLVTRASPDKYSLGTMNGLSQATTSTARAMGPATFTSLFAFSKEYNLLGGNLVYVLLLILLCLLVFLSRRLPELKKDKQ
ncbi:MFS general substrate transporter [Pisolithus croceorrhizus]|nr:MFS general substrate transporter [Pisolithus croceorrhizus]